MSFFKNSRRALVVLGLVGLSAAASTTQASAFGFSFGGGHGGGHFGGFGGGGHFGGGGFGGGHLGGGRQEGGHFGGFGGRFSGIGFGHFGGGRYDWGRHSQGDRIRPGRIECFRAPCTTGGGGYPPTTSCRYSRSCGNPWTPGIRCLWTRSCGTSWPPIVNCRWTHSCGTSWPPIVDCRWTHSCGGQRPLPCRYTPWASFCRTPWVPPAVIPVRYPTPQFNAPTPSYVAPLPSYTPAVRYAATAPSYTPPATCVKDPTIWVVFQPTATANDISALLKGFNVTMENGPDANSMYRLRVNNVPSEQIGQLIEALRAQTNIVNQAGA